MKIYFQRRDAERLRKIKEIFNSFWSNSASLRLGVLIFAFASPVFSQTFSAAEYYQLADGNEWRYAAPPGWKEGDYISRIKFSPKLLNYCGAREQFHHYDATGAAKVLRESKSGIYYDGEIFADKSQILFLNPILWFSAKLKIGDKTEAKTDFVRLYDDMKVVRGTFEIKQKIAAKEDVTVTAGTFKNCLRVESETFWELGDGRKARSINVYHYAPRVGVVKASARFIILDASGKELINRPVETDLKSAVVNGKAISKQN